jgi:two-component system sensor histidine kinase PilS (NtrC family)
MPTMRSKAGSIHSALGGLTALHLLRLFNRVRLSFGIILIALGASSASKIFFSSDVLGAPIFSLGVLYLCSAALIYRLITGIRQTIFVVAYVSNTIDVILIALLLGLAGLDSGFQSLLIIPALSGALLLRQPHTYAVAAASSLLVLALYILEGLNGSFVAERFLSAGALGITLFAIALAVQFVARQLSDGADEIKAVGIDLANLTAVNDLVIQNLDLGVIVCDRAGNVKMANHLAFQFLGLPQTARYSSLKLLNNQLAERLSLWRLLPNERISPIEIEGRKVAPTFRHLGDNLSACMIYLNDAEKVSREVQKHKLASLGQLTASIAHEIRNPLSAIASAGQLLEEGGNLSAGDARLADIIRDHCIRVNTIIENVLQLSSRQSDVASDLNIGRWLTKFVDDYCQMANIDSSTIVVTVSDSPDLRGVNSSHLDQVLSNLLDNAVKYGNGRKNSVSMDAHLSPDKNNFWIDVVDQGPGIPIELATRIFEPFYTAGGGTGLGLYIANELAAVNGATLSVVPRPSGKQGAHFRLSFKL